MEDDESFDDFYFKLNDIINTSFNLGEKDISCEKNSKIS